MLEPARTAKKGVAQKTRGAATPMARGEKNGICVKMCASATFHHVF